MSNFVEIVLYMVLISLMFSIVLFYCLYINRQLNKSYIYLNRYEEYRRHRSKLKTEIRAQRSASKKSKSKLKSPDNKTVGSSGEPNAMPLPGVPQKDNQLVNPKEE